MGHGKKIQENVRLTFERMMKIKSLGITNSASSPISKDFSCCSPIILLFTVNKYATKELFIPLYRMIILNSYLKLVTKRALC